MVEGRTQSHGNKEAKKHLLQGSSCALAYPVLGLLVVIIAVTLHQGKVPSSVLAPFGVELYVKNPQEAQSNAAGSVQSDGDVSSITPPLSCYRPIFLHSLEHKDETAYDSPLDLHPFLNLTVYLNGNFDNGISAKVPKLEICHSKRSFIAHFSTYWMYCRGSCRVFLNNGWEVRSCLDLRDDDNVWLVPPKREFVWPVPQVGHKVELRHVTTPEGKAIVVESVSISPRVFIVHNLFSPDEAEEIMSNVLNPPDPRDRLMGSQVGETVARSDLHRTSENGWDINSKVSNKLMKRCFEVAGIRPFNLDWGDGLQVLRYNRSKAYNIHIDYVPPSGSEAERLDSANGGINRFITFILYLTDVEEGGETVFPIGAGAIDSPCESQAIAELRARNVLEGIRPGSWEEDLIGQCKTKLSVKPKKGRAVMFYNQRPNGEFDDASLHGGCPILKGTKWAASLWIWNGEMYERKNKPSKPKVIVATFRTTVPGYSLYHEEGFQGRLDPVRPIRVDALEGQRFFVREGDGYIKGAIMQTFIIGQNSDQSREYIFDGHGMKDGDL